MFWLRNKKIIILLRTLNKSPAHYKSMGTINPHGKISLGPRGLTGRMYVGDHKALLPTKYTSCGPHDSREEYFI